MNVRRVESKGSIWLLDDGLGRYMRMPKTERPRDPAEYGDARAGALQDLVWHPMLRWFITDATMRGRITRHDGEEFRIWPGTLCIEREEGHWTTAPDAAVQR